ncbi:MAG: hypothetical protein DLM57_01660 [Pseudonocardiales bacterium]|nr:MAG: hypothetical protein DLM57_01660 [Pseudonocardiales bacterium]
MAQNPVINKFGRVSGGNRPGLPTPSAGDLQDMYSRPAYAGPTGSGRYMTLDDVVQRTGAMLAVVLVAGGVSWAVTPDRLALPVLLTSALVGLALGLYLSFSMKVNAGSALVYSAIEGVFLGAISRIFNHAYPGIVIQAITGTAMVAGGMLFVYKIGAIRVTPKFTRIVVGATIGVVGLMFVNLAAYLFHPGGLGLRGDASGNGTAIAIGFSVLCIVIASMNLVVDFDMIEKGIRNGADEKFAWYASFALMVTLIWLYIEILRLLSYFARR